MAAEMPVPIEFQLPQVGACPSGGSRCSWCCLRGASQRRPGPGFTTNITIDGEQRSHDASLTEIADESLNKLHQVSRTVSLSPRSEFGPADAPGLAQVLAVSTGGGQDALALTQCQVYLSMPDVAVPRGRAVVRLALTATKDVFDSVFADFQEFAASVRPKNR